MDLNEYQEFACRTEMNSDTRELLLKNALGLAGEAGEYIEDVKHACFHGRELNRENAKKELGDILWYVAASAKALGLTLEDIGMTNIDKLRRRYPDGYNHEASAARADEKQ